MGFLSKMGGPLAGKLGGAINPLSGLGMAGSPMSGMGAMMGGGGGLGAMLASIGLGSGGGGDGAKPGPTGSMPPPPASMMPGAMGDVSSPMNPISQGPAQAPTNFGQPHGNVSPSMFRQMMAGAGRGLQQQGQPQPMAELPQQSDPLAILRSLGIDLNGNFLGRLGQQ